MIGQLEQLLGQLDELRERAIAELGPITLLSDLDEWDIRYLGRNKGELKNLSAIMPKLSKEERPVVGQRINAVKSELERQLSAKRENLKQQEMIAALEQERIDVTLPGRALPVGHMHPISRTIREVTQIFERMGFSVVQGREVETDYYNFQALNVPADHPARDMQDTFWVNPGQILLRTHTSPMQVRTMKETEPPVRVVVPGKVYRNEAVDATHEAMFHQIEGLLVDEYCTMADLKGCLERFAQELFGIDTKIRFRGSYFPFTEPSAEVDVTCSSCHGEGCRVCKYSGWLEVLGAGMVHPKLLREVGYDPTKYRGFAFGMGVERIAMLKYGLGEIRLFSGNDLRFLRQF
ncbi:phenylalanine--tRNA ligase subunit alpha [Tengunoibacter tsumagoiensis]|uniref:Phenylalanine--tRNA ligase alpha subunit n=1 Tax=Tengunoibacter tsumagoiensis TaxID=2014871 RepID=A0A402A5F6_9CHLR|nr:phenylalanine--tRNA ligase subunit alpha [Tengunoibacter tsumagoiensis]GCE14342.1 phenylalanine--tRNA ligase alpha subunit [Tengunoibacter tsumagoiensis]